MQEDDADQTGARAARYAVAAGPLLRAESYAQRGRMHQHLTAAELQLGLEAALKQWAIDPFDKSARDRHSDYESEFALRAQEPDYARVGSEIDAISTAVAQMLGDMDPDQKLKIGHSIVEDYERAQARKS